MSEPTDIDLERLRAHLLEREEREVPASSRAARAMRLLPASMRDPLRASVTGLVGRRSQRRLRDAARAGGLRLHLASGFNPKDGWVNIDLLGAPVDVAWNLAKGIPLPDDSAEAIFHEHLQEHLSLRAGFLLNRECFRVLRPGGVLRVAVPDAGLCLRSYAGTDDPDWASSQPTPMLSVLTLFYEHGHRAMYDGQTLAAELAAAGFEQAAQREFGETRIQPCPDSESRHGGTLYVEGVKPGAG
jgi:predicted SAM-dependent methyltransferase